MAKELNDIQIEEVLDEYSQKNNDDITLNQSQRTKELFKKVMIEETNINKNLQEQQDLITSLLLKVKEGWSDTQIFNYHSDNKHLSYFTLIMGDEQAKVLFKKLELSKIPTSIFRGLKLNTPDKHPIDIPGLGTVVVTQTFKTTENESLELDDFIVTLNGKEIYNFKTSVNPEFEEEEDESVYDTYVTHKDLTQMENDLSRKLTILYNKKKAGKSKTYNVKKGKATVVENINAPNDKYPNGVTIEIIIGRYGKPIYKARDKATGQFVQYRRK